MEKCAVYPCFGRHKTDSIVCDACNLKDECITSTSEKQQNPVDSYMHYFKVVSHLSVIDVYRVLDLFEITDPAIAHATKKLLCAGKRGAKDQAKDIQEAIDALKRWQDMQAENEKAPL